MSCPNFCPKWSHWKSPLGSVGISHLSRKGLPARHFHLQGDSWLWCTLHRTSGRGPSSSCEWCGFPECWAQQGYWDPEDSWRSQHARLLFFFFVQLSSSERGDCALERCSPQPSTWICCDRLARPLHKHWGNCTLSPSLTQWSGEDGETDHALSQPANCIAQTGLHFQLPSFLGDLHSLKGERWICPGTA